MIEDRPTMSASCLPKLRNQAKFRQKFDLTALQGHPRSSILVSMASTYVTSFNYNGICYRFYPRDAMLARVIAIATCPFVCPSVRPSVRHEPVLCQNEET